MSAVTTGFVPTSHADAVHPYRAPLSRGLTAMFCLSIVAVLALVQAVGRTHLPWVAALPIDETVLGTLFWLIAIGALIGATFALLQMAGGWFGSGQLRISGDEIEVPTGIRGVPVAINARQITGIEVSHVRRHSVIRLHTAARTYTIDSACLSDGGMSAVFEWIDNHFND